MKNTLGIDKTPKDTKIVVAMSGGVDSSVVAGLMKEQGYNVTGITLKLYDDSKVPNAGRQCCAGQDILDAKRVSEQLGIDHKILFHKAGALILLGRSDRFAKHYAQQRICNSTMIN